MKCINNYSPPPPTSPPHHHYIQQLANTPVPSVNTPALVGLLMGRGTASMDSGCCGDRLCPPPPPPPPAPPLSPSIIGCCEGGGTAGFFNSVASPTLSLLCRPLTGESRDAWSDSSAPNIFLHSGFCTKSLMLEHFNDSEKKKR